MAKRLTHTIGLDIGTSRVTCIVAATGEDGLLNIVGIGESDSRGLRKGVIVNPEAAVESIKRAVEEAERMSGLEAEEVTINLAGSHILGFNGQAIVAVAGRDREITAEDVRRAIDSACAIQLPAGREIVDRLPQEFIVDDQDGINDPVGMIGRASGGEGSHRHQPGDRAPKRHQRRESRRANRGRHGAGATRRGRSLVD